MCTPYLDDLKSRILKLNESLRSARLKCFEVKALAQVPQFGEPILFTAKQLTVQVIAISDEISDVISESCRWNSTTSQDIIAEFYNEAISCRASLVGLIREADLLRKQTQELGLPLEEYAGNQAFESLFHSLPLLSQEVEGAGLLEVVQQQLSEYENDTDVRMRVLSELSARLPDFVNSISSGSETIPRS